MDNTRADSGYGLCSVGMLPMPECMQWQTHFLDLLTRIKSEFRQLVVVAVTEVPRAGSKDSARDILPPLTKPTRGAQRRGGQRRLRQGREGRGGRGGEEA